MWPFASGTSSADKGSDRPLPASAGANSSSAEGGRRFSSTSSASSATSSSSSESSGATGGGAKSLVVDSVNYVGATRNGVQPRLSVTIATACQSKDPPLPLPLPVHMTCDCGEDAFFVTADEPGTTVVFGLADGVGGWRRHGVDPSKFAWRLMQNCETFAQAADASKPGTPTAVLQQAYSQLIEKKEVSPQPMLACMR